MAEMYKSWEVHCFLCERALLGIGRHRSRPDAEAEARDEGWRIRAGQWVCGPCQDGEEPAGVRKKVIQRAAKRASTLIGGGA